MRKFVKKQILDIFDTLYQAHKSAEKCIKSKDEEAAISLLGDCQNTAVEVGNILDESDPVEADAIHLLEEYCEVVYRVSVETANGIKGNAAREMLDNSLRSAEKHIRENVKERLEIVFMPYKASMWDSLESVWKAADEDPDCDAYVVPIPYYDRNPDHSFGKYHYEGRDYPNNVPITHYDQYDLSAHRPDVIYIHNPYDAQNYVTSVDPRFYSSKLKKYTKCLTYCEYGVPYNVFKEPMPLEQYDSILDSWFNFDLYIVFSKVIENNLRFALNKYKPNCKTNIIALGSPKFDKIVNSTITDYSLPDEWIKIKSGKKVVLFNTGLTVMLKNSDSYMQRLRNVLNIFKNNNEVVLWWRPHPLMESTIKSMRPDLHKEYSEIVKEYIREGWGIYDLTTDLDRAITCTDAYYGDISSVVYLYCATGKPFTIVDFPYDNYMFTEDTNTFDKCLNWRINNMKCAPGANIDNYNIMIWWSNFYEDLDYKKFLRLYLDYVAHSERYQQAELYRKLQIELYHEFVENYDGTAGIKIHEYTKNYVKKPFS